MASAHHLLVDPGMGPAWKIWNTSYAMYLAVLASMVHGFTVPAGIEMGQRLRGYTRGIFEWLKKAPWGDPGFSGAALSVVIFGFLGGVTGVTIGTEQINIIAHNTLRVPGHFHTTVVGGTALAFMAVTYYVLPLIFRKRVAFWGLAKLQPYLFGIGIVILSMSMIFQGIFGVPRRQLGHLCAERPLPDRVPSGRPALPGHHGNRRAARHRGRARLHPDRGGDACSSAARSGWPTRTTRPASRRACGSCPQQTYQGAAVDAVHKSGTPGTVVLVFIFLACFILYYFANWKMLSFVWKVG